MRKIIVSEMVSLDGVMQAPGGPQEDTSGGFKFGGWTWAYQDDVGGKILRETFAKPFDLLLGRKTYDIWAGYWPHHESDEFNFVAKAFNKATKYVATRAKTPLTWAKSVALHDAAADLARLKREDGPDLLVQGSSNLLQTLLAHDLIDRITLRVYPVILGEGKRFFGSGTKSGALKLESSVTTLSGVTVVTYVPAGPVKTGTFE